LKALVVNLLSPDPSERKTIDQILKELQLMK
jgi:hypothetical protein